MKPLTKDFVVGDFLGEIVDHVAGRIASASRDAIAAEDVSLVLPPPHTESDLAFRCFELARSWKANPAQIAQEMAANLEPTDLVSRFTAVGPYLNIHLRRDAVVPRVLQAVLGESETYGHSRRQGHEVVMMEYISPNTNKPLHLGHIRNGVLGRAVANLIAAQGATVSKTDIINDRGVHIAKSMIAYERWAEGSTPATTGTKGDHFVGDLYVRFEQALRNERESWLEREGIDPATLDDQESREVEARFNEQSALMRAARDLLKRWEERDPEVRALWERMNGWVYAGFDATYRKLGIEFDQHYYESEIFQGGKAIILDALEKGIFVRTENGAVVAPLSQHSKLQDKTVLRADGTGLYVTQDINLATIKFKDFGLTRSIYCIGSEQDFYMKQLFAILKLLGFPWADGLYHLSYGMVYLPEGKMKSREGTVVDADRLIEEMVEHAQGALRERYPDLDPAEIGRRAPAIGLSGMSFRFLMVGKDTDIYFDPKESVSFEGKTGPYLQYAYARCASILRKTDDSWRTADVWKLREDIAWRIAFNILLFPCIVADAADSYDPSRLANYLIELAQTFNTFYHDHPVLKAEEPLRSSRLALVCSFQTVIGNGLRLLSIEPLEVM